MTWRTPEVMVLLSAAFVVSVFTSSLLLAQRVMVPEVRCQPPVACRITRHGRNVNVEILEPSTSVPR